MDYYGCVTSIVNWLTDSIVVFSTYDEDILTDVSAWCFLEPNSETWGCEKCYSGSVIQLGVKV